MRAVTKNYDQTFITNSNGYNDFEINGKIDILIIGDSYVEAIEINQKNYEKLIDEAADEISSFVEKANLENLS